MLEIHATATPPTPTLFVISFSNMWDWLTAVISLYLKSTGILSQSTAKQLVCTYIRHFAGEFCNVPASTSVIFMQLQTFIGCSKVFSSFSALATKSLFPAMSMPWSADTAISASYPFFTQRWQNGLKYITRLICCNNLNSSKSHRNNFNSVRLGVRTAVKIRSTIFWLCATMQHGRSLLMCQRNILSPSSGLSFKTSMQAWNHIPEGRTHFTLF